MLFGPDTYTNIHVLLSLAGIAWGLVALLGMLANAQMPATTALFLFATILTSVTGFGFPFVTLLPSHIVGLISLVVLALAVYARYGAHLTGVWRPAYIATATAALYLNVFVLVVQLFLKIPSLNALAPTQTEIPFVLAQGSVLVLFAILGTLALRRFYPYAS